MKTIILILALSFAHIGSFTTEFCYWKSNGGDKEDNCSRVETEDFII